MSPQPCHFPNQTKPKESWDPVTWERPLKTKVNSSEPALVGWLAVLSLLKSIIREFRTFTSKLYAKYRLPTCHWWWPLHKWVTRSTRGTTRAAERTGLEQSKIACRWLVPMRLDTHPGTSFKTRRQAIAENAYFESRQAEVSAFIHRLQHVVKDTTGNETAAATIITSLLSFALPVSSYPLPISQGDGLLESTSQAISIGYINLKGNLRIIYAQITTVFSGRKIESRWLVCNSFGHVKPCPSDHHLGESTTIGPNLS